MPNTLDLKKGKDGAKQGHASNICIEQIAQGWHHDPEMLDAYYEVVLRNWKDFQGTKPRNLQSKITATLLQINRGDFLEEPDLSVEVAIRYQTPGYQLWKQLAGTTKDTAKRRFITLMKSIDERLLEIKLKPAGYALSTKEGLPVCPWANTARGCPLPLLSKEGTPIIEVIQKRFSSLRRPENFRRWIGQNEDHGCALGIHLPLTTPAVSGYLRWFRQKICGGFQPYDCNGFRKLVRTVVDRQAAHFQEIMTRSREYSYAEVEAELDILFAMKNVYETYAKEDYVYEVPCTRTNFHCEQRRLTDAGSNHTHPITLSLANATFTTTAYDKVIEVREECRRLGLSAKTGVLKDSEKRYRVLKERLINNAQRVAAGEEARERLAAEGHKIKARALIPSRAKAVLNQNLDHAITSGLGDHIKRAIRLGADKDLETATGITAVIRAVLQGDVKLVKELVHESGCSINYMNKKGMTPLSWACMKGEPSMIETLMDLGADPSMEGRSSNRTPFMLAVEHNHTLAVELILEHLFKGNGGSRGVDQVLNQRTSRGGMTSLLLITEQRNWGMIRLLLRKNASRMIRNAKGQIVETVARQAGWTAIADFLRTTRAIGPNGFYSSMDDQEEKDIQEKSTNYADYLQKHGVNVPGSSIHPRSSNNVSASLPSSSFDPTKTFRTSSLPAATTRISQEDHDVEPRKITSLAASKDLRVLASPGLLVSGNDDTTAEELRKPSSLFSDANAAIHPSITLLRTNKVPPNLETDDGSTGLICAAYAGDLELVRSFLAEGATLDYANRHGKTALMAAAASGSHELIVELLKSGADINKEDAEGRSCIFYAHQAGHHLLLTFLKRVRLHGLEEALAKYDTMVVQEEERENQARQQHLLEKYGLNNRRKTEKEGGGANVMKRTAKADIGLRCWKCTVFVPCTHFKNKKALKQSMGPGVEGAWRWHHQPKGYHRQRRAKNGIEGDGDHQSPQPPPPPHHDQKGNTAEMPEAAADSASSPDVMQDSPSATISSSGHTGGEEEHTPTFVSTMTDEDYDENQRWEVYDEEEIYEQQRQQQQEQQEWTYASQALTSKRMKTPPLRLLYSNVRRLLTPPNQPRDHSNPYWEVRPGGSDLLRNMGKSEEPIVQLLTHGTLLDDLTLMWAQDKEILGLRAIPSSSPQRQQQQDQSSQDKYDSFGFMSIDMRRGLCLYPPCTRCGIGFAKLKSEALDAALCDLCILILASSSSASPSPFAASTSSPSELGQLSHIRPSSANGEEVRRICLQQQQQLDSKDEVPSHIRFSISDPSSGENPTRRRSSLAKPPPPSSSPSTFARRSSLALANAFKKKARRATSMVDDVITGGRRSFLPPPADSNRRHSAGNNNRASDVEHEKEAKEKTALRSSSYVLNEVRDELLGAFKAGSNAGAKVKRKSESSIETMIMNSHKNEAEAKGVEANQKLAADAAGCYRRAPSLDLAEFLIAKRRLDEAEGLLLKTLDDHLGLYGPYHISIALILRSLGQVEEIRGVFPAARAYRETSYEILFLIFGSIHWEAIRAINLLVRSLQLQDLIPEALHFYKETCRQLRSYHVKHYRQVAEMLEENYDKLEARYASKTRRKTIPPEDVDKGLRRVSMSSDARGRVNHSKVAEV